MTSSAQTFRPAAGRSSRRVVPRGLDDAQRERVRGMLNDPDTWVLRHQWEPFLRGEVVTLVATDELSCDHRTAVRAWLEQQQHRLHEELEGDRVAPEGWLASFPLVQRLMRRPA